MKKKENIQINSLMRNLFYLNAEHEYVLQQVEDVQKPCKNRFFAVFFVPT